jgi:hypothetical protein
MDMGIPTDWLLDSDPSIRWQVMRHLLDEPADVVAAERARVATEGWGKRLLDLQTDDGQWGGGDYSPKWTSTTYTLLLLRHLGIDPATPQAQRAVERVRESIVLGAAKWPFFAYRGETCITGMMLSLAAYFDEVDDTVIDWLLDEQLGDGGWNCQTVHGSTRSSFNTTISVLEGLLEYERGDGGAGVAEARRRGEEYLLERRLMRSLSSREVIDQRWTLFSFPPRWHYDVLRGLEHLAEAGGPPDERCEEAIALVEAKRRRDGRWPLQNHHRGREHFSMEEGSGKPSRWNTLRALRVLRWYRGG